jgi:hypothetical protein
MTARNRVIVTAALAGGLTIGAPAVQADAASPASGSCTFWHDSNTYGISCKGFASGDAQEASAQCNNGQWVHGNMVSATNGSWSYAYCAGKGGYKLGTGAYVVFG